MLIGIFGEWIVSGGVEILGGIIIVGFRGMLVGGMGLSVVGDVIMGIVWFLL